MQNYDRWKVCPNCGSKKTKQVTLAKRQAEARAERKAERQAAAALKKSAEEASRAAEAGAADETTCPFCAESVKRAAIKCKHCGEFFDQGTDLGS